MNKLFLYIILLLCLLKVSTFTLTAQTTISIGNSYTTYGDWSNKAVTGVPWYKNICPSALQLTLYKCLNNKQALLLNCTNYFGGNYGHTPIGKASLRNYINLNLNYGIPIYKYLYLFFGPAIMYKFENVVVYHGFDDIEIGQTTHTFGISTQIDYEAIHYKHLSIHAFARIQAHYNTTLITTAGINVGYKFNWRRNKQS